MENLFSRRALAAALPLAALAAAPVVVLPSPVSRHPDEDLLKLVDELRASETRRRALDEETEEIFDRIEFVDIPDALVWRKSDFPGICMDPRENCAQYLIGGELQYVYEDRDAIASWWTDPNPPRNPHAFSELDRPRAKEILEAIAEWESANKQAEDEAGFTKVQQAADREAERCAELRRQIIFTRARTPDGMMAKVHAMAALFHDDPEWIKKRLQEAVTRNDSADISRWFGMSLALDALSLRDPEVPAIVAQKGVAA